VMFRTKLNITCCGFVPGGITRFGPEPPDIKKEKEKNSLRNNII